jgi:hypothetical protein
MSRFANLGRQLAAVDDDELDDGEGAPAVAPTNPNQKSKSKSKDNEMTDDDHKAAVEAAVKTATESTLKGAKDRMNTVFASEHFAGREATAAKLLTTSDMKAEAIVDVLAGMPAETKGKELSVEDQRAAAEEAGRKEMKDALGDASKNAEIDANGGDGSKKPNAAAVWDQAIALNNPGTKQG